MLKFQGSGYIHRYIDICICIGGVLDPLVCTFTWVHTDTPAAIEVKWVGVTSH